MFWNKNGKDDEPVGLYVPEEDEEEIEEVEETEDDDLDVRMSWDDEDEETEEVEETEDDDLDDLTDDDFYVDDEDEEELDEEDDDDYLDDEDNDDIITLVNADGEEVDFVEIAGIAYKGNFYAILQPVELLEGMDDDEALVFKVSKNKDGSDKFDIELDDEIIAAVFEEYDRLLEEANN